MVEFTVAFANVGTICNSKQKEIVRFRPTKHPSERLIAVAELIVKTLQLVIFNFAHRW